MYIQREPNPSGSYPPLQSQSTSGLLYFPPQFEELFYNNYGFVRLEISRVEKPRPEAPTPQVRIEIDEETGEEIEVINEVEIEEVPIEYEDVITNVTINEDALNAWRQIVEIDESRTEKENEIKTLKEELSATDYKIIKCMEAQLNGDEMPYDVATLQAERQAKRDRINELEGQL